MTVVEDRLNQIRGAAPRKPHNARSLAALTANPGCPRRAVMDAAGTDKERLAAYLGFPAPIGRMSSIALARGQSFEARVKADGCAELLRLLRDHIGLPVKESHYHDLNAVTDDDRINARFIKSKNALSMSARSADDIGTLFDHPILQLTVAGVPAFIEPDLIAYKLGDRFYIVEIKSFPILDGAADGAKVGAAARQSAVYVLAMRNMLEAAGHSPNLVSHDVVLVCPKDFTNQPEATLVDVRKHLGALRRQLTRMDAIETVLNLLDTGLTFDLQVDAGGMPRRDPKETAEAVAQVRARYAPECLSTCELAGVCRAEAAGSTAVLGRTVREDLGGIDSVTYALSLARGDWAPTAEHTQAAQILRTAYQLRQECVGA